jgi:hypothetical protein
MAGFTADTAAKSGKPLDQLIAGDLADGDEGRAKALRAIVDRVSVMPAPAQQAPEIRIEGHLETLLKRSFGDCPIPGVSVVENRTVPHPGRTCRVQGRP